MGWCLLGCLMLALASWSGNGARSEAVSAGASTDATTVATADATEAVSVGALDPLSRLALERAYAEGVEAHQPRAGADTVVLGEARVDHAGAHVAGVSVGLVAMGRGASLHEVDATASAQIAGPEVQIERAPGVTEWWRSLPSGLEQGVTLTKRPAGEGELVLEMSAGEDVVLALAGDEVTIARDGERIATYGGLFAYDADGVTVPARLAVRGDRIALHVEDASARYPLVVDPLVVLEGPALRASSASAAEFGVSVSLSADGTRALVGSRNDDSNRGAAYVFVRSGGGWTQEARLVASDGATGHRFGWSVSLSADGTRALVGARIRNAGYVFVRSGTTWTQESTLLASDGVASDLFGSAVSLSADGTRALIGAEGDDSRRGSAYVFLRSGTTWTQQAKLTAGDGAASHYFGVAVSLSADGAYALVGAPQHSTGRGSAYVFLRSGATWTQQTRLVASDGVAGDLFGSSVSLSADGSRGLVGAVADDSRRGSAYVFARSGSTWTQQAKLVAADGVANNDFGGSVSLSSDGRRALVGAIGTATRGGAYVFVSSGTTWVQEAKLTATDGAIGDQVGASVALSANGLHALAGAPGDDSGGSARTFVLTATCSAASECGTGFCVDGVCCEAACGGGANDCQACSRAMTGVASGICAPLTAALAPTVTCRAAGASGACDAAADVCSSTSTMCPTDTSFALPGTLCRPSRDLCDREEVCNGASLACPDDLRSTAGTVCRNAVDVCDVVDVCDGVSDVCVDRKALAGVVCEPSLSDCDPEDVCDGAGGCPMRFAVAGTICAPAGPGACDAPDVCTGTSADCVPTFLSGVECRPSAGACDPSELCSGASELCPPDSVHPAATVCRAAVSSCDTVESCDGFAAQCPPDLTTCTGDEDAGGLARDAGVGDAGAADAAVALTTDGAVTADAAPDAPTPTTSCGCRTARSDDGRWLGLAVLGVLLALRRQRRRASDRVTSDRATNDGATSD